MTAKEFINKEYFGLTLDCSRDIDTIYLALEDYANYKVSSITDAKKQRELLIDFASKITYSAYEQIGYNVESYVDSYIKNNL